MILQELLDNITQEINAEIVKAKGVEQVRITLEELDHALKKKREELDKREKELLIKIENQKKEEEYLVSALEETRNLEAKQARFLEEKEAFAKLKQLFDEEKSRMDQKRLELDEKLKQAVLLDQREKELEHRDELLKRDSLHNRTQIEDVERREKEVETEKKRLQQIADKWNEK